jgi:signal transduction histidine kinase
VQEGLTNVVKHAGAARAEVMVTYLSEAIELSVHDDGCNGHSAGLAGHGLLGIRERVAVFEGTVDMGPVAEGGWRLPARLPIQGGGGPV